MNKVREKLDRIDERLERIEQTYDILREIAKEFYESRKRQRQPNRYRSYEKGHRANQDGHFGYKEHPKRDGDEICYESRVPDVSSHSSGYRIRCSRLFSKFRNGETLYMRWLLGSLLIFGVLALIVWMTKDIPFLGYYKIK